jgi:hypothetical protein
MWLDLPNGQRYLITAAYLAGVTAAQQNRPPIAPAPRRGAIYAQWWYGYRNEKAGLHDSLPSSFDELILKFFE